MAQDETKSRQRRMSAGAFVLGLVLLAPLAWVAYQGEADAARQRTLDRAFGNLDESLLFLRLGDEVAPPVNTWHADSEAGWINPVGDTWTEPPLTNLVQSVGTGTMVREYDFDGQWLAAGKWVGGAEILLTVVGREQQEADVAAARWRWVIIPVLLALIAAAITWYLAGRFRGPVQRAHDVNRDFIADAAHELRTPLSIIQASAGHALSRERGADEYRESLGEILTATERASSSVGELLEFARLEAGQAAPRLAPLRLDLLVEEVAASVRVDDTVIEAEASDAVVVSADYNLIRQVVDNLTRNAAARADKVSLSTSNAVSTAGAGLVANGLSTSGNESMARIDITDDGPGFDSGMIDHVFERFRRGDRAGAAGLGMAIARTIVDLHGGRCEAANREADGVDGGNGAIVTVYLPYK